MKNIDFCVFVREVQCLTFSAADTVGQVLISHHYVEFCSFLTASRLEHQLEVLWIVQIHCGFCFKNPFHKKVFPK